MTDFAHVLRPATAEDLPAVRALVAAVGREYGFEPEPENVDADLYADSPAYFSEGGALEVLVDAQETVVGVLGVLDVHAGEDAELRKLYLGRELRGKGMGRRLLDRALELAREGRARRLVLETSTRLKEGLALYERAGFVPEAAEHAPRSCSCDVRLALEL